MTPDAVLLVATIRALKVHSGNYPTRQGRPLPDELFQENTEAVLKGCSNLEAQVKNVRSYGVPVVVAINRFPTDTEAEIEVVKERALAAGARAAEVSEVHAKGGEGGAAIGQAIIDAAESGEADFKLLYPDEAPLTEKVEALALKIYGAGSVEFSAAAKKTLARLEEQGYGKLPICMAKTQYSLSHDAQFKGAPEGFVFPVREARLAAGAGFVVVYAGAIMTMPGLGRTPAYKQVDIDENGEILGLF